MPHSYAHILIHYIFSTKNREKFLTNKVRRRIWDYMGGIAKNNEMHPKIIGGVEDHVHLLVQVPRTISIAHAVQLIKGGSSKWIHETFPELENFAWQEGYGAFSVSKSHENKVKTYILNQQMHHRKKTFKEEFLEFLHAHEIEYDPRYIWD